MDKLEYEDLKYRYNYLGRTYQEYRILEKSVKEPSKTINEIVQEKFQVLGIGEKMFNLFEINLCTLNAVVQKEKFIINKKKLKINEELVDKYIKQLAVEEFEDGSFIIGPKKFKDSVDFLNLIRNKFAHGEYKYDLKEDEILFLVENKCLPIPREWLKQYNNFILNNIKQFYTEGEFKEMIIKINTPSWKKIDNFKEYKNALKKMLCIEFSIKPQEDKKYDNLELVEISNIINKITAKINKCACYSNEINNIKKYCEENGLEFKFSIKNAINNDISEEIRKKLYDLFYIIPDFTKLEEWAQANILTQKIIEILNNHDNREKIKFALSNFFNYIENIKQNRGYISFQQYVNKYPQIFNYYSNIRVLLTLSKFNLVFNYNMETVYNKYLDYSKLDLSKIEEKINIFEDLKLTKKENSQTEIINQLKKAYNIKEEIESKLNIRYEQLIKYPEQKKLIETIDILDTLYNENYEKITKLESELLIKKEERLKYEEEISKNGEYNKNKNIINHIRNSIEHGNFIIEEEKDDVKVIFKDIYKGRITYEGSVKLIDLEKICFNGFIKSMDTMGNLLDEEKEYSKK